MINHNPELEIIIANATDLAKKYNHEYVTLEHLTHGLISFKPFNDLLVSFGADVECRQVERLKLRQGPDWRVSHIETEPGE